MRIGHGLLRCFAAPAILRKFGNRIARCASRCCFPHFRCLAKCQHVPASELAVRVAAWQEPIRERRTRFTLLKRILPSFGCFHLVTSLFCVMKAVLFYTLFIGLPVSKLNPAEELFPQGLISNEYSVFACTPPQQAKHAAPTRRRPHTAPPDH